MDIKQLIEVLKKHPTAYIYYTGQGEFTIYTHKGDFDREYHGEGNFDDYEIFKGSDSKLANGYIPVLVEALATILGFDVDSV